MLQKGYWTWRDGGQNTRPIGSARAPYDPAQNATLQMLPYPRHLENSVAQVLDEVPVEIESQFGDRSQHWGAGGEQSARGVFKWKILGNETSPSINKNKLIDKDFCAKFGPAGGWVANPRRHSPHTPVRNGCVHKRFGSRVAEESKSLLHELLMARDPSIFKASSIASSTPSSLPHLFPASHLSPAFLLRLQRSHSAGPM